MAFQHMLGLFLILKSSLAFDILTGCNGPLGMESGDIKDAQITASHWLYKSLHYAPKHARLNQDSLSGAWCSEGIDQHPDQYIQIDLLKNTKLTGIATQSRSKNEEYIEKFQLLYQRDGDDHFRMYNESGQWKEFTANVDNVKIAINSFQRPLIVRKIRIYPRGDEFSIYCGRFELYGCKWSHQLSTLNSYTAPLGNSKNGMDTKDTTYDGVQKSDQLLHDGLGKLTDDMYGSKDTLLGSNGSPWVAYNDKKPTVILNFKEKKVIKQIMIHVNNNNNDIKVFQKVMIMISNDGNTYTLAKEYETNEEQRQKIDAYPVVCNVGEVVAKHVKIEFVKQGEWLLISEIVVMTDTYPPTPVVPTTDNKIVVVRHTTRRVVTSAPSIFVDNNNDEKTKEKEKKASKGLSFPIILTIALVTLVLAVVVFVIIYKSYKKNRKPSAGGHPRHSQQQQQTQLSNHQKQDNSALLNDERYMAAFHHPQPLMPAAKPQQSALLPQNGMYFQPAMHQGNYNTKVMMG